MSVTSVMAVVVENEQDCRKATKRRDIRRRSMLADWDGFSEAGHGRPPPSFDPVPPVRFTVHAVSMNWVILSLLSACLLGCYDIAKKLAARGNAVPAVLLFSVGVGAVIWSPLLVWSLVDPAGQPIGMLSVVSLTARQHVLVIAKSMLVAASWTFSLFALKHLPLSIAAPIRSTSPMWTIGMAITLFGERPGRVQWIGITIVLTAFWAFSVVGRREGIHFAGNRWVGCMVLATISGSISGVYDKYLLQTIQIPPATLQAWFSVYLVPATLPCFAWWFLRQRTENRFQFRWSVLLISPLLLATDLVYFTAVSDPDALISVVSTIRRCSLVIAFAFGIRALKEEQLIPKAACVVAILIGAAVLTLSR